RRSLSKLGARENRRKRAGAGELRDRRQTDNELGHIAHLPSDIARTAARLQYASSESAPAFGSSQHSERCPCQRCAPLHGDSLQGGKTARTMTAGRGYRCEANDKSPGAAHGSDTPDRPALRPGRGARESAPPPTQRLNTEEPEE